MCQLFSYNSYYAYGQSKLANILHAKELARRLKGASTTCYLALNPKVKEVSGEYFADNNVYKPSDKANDAELAKKLWEFGMGLTKSKYVYGSIPWLSLVDTDTVHVLLFYSCEYGG
ncbi:putative very-long-chain 3-oxoacyl-CoA reductase [Helianthus annuus]|nr:putative very-long-chain 3-oxoacyl-CoA reductase [Helianthus annuus]